VTRRPSRLAAANVAFVAAMTLHGIDHTRQARGVGGLAPEVVWGGAVLFALAATTLWLTLHGHPRAPLAAALVGLWTAAAVSASHLAPHWSAFSDPYAGLSLGVWSWIVVIAEIATALVLGVLGVVELRRPVRA
jgi:hypothetical protein